MRGEAADATSHCRKSPNYWPPGATLCCIRGVGKAAGGGYGMQAEGLCTRLLAELR